MDAAFVKAKSEWERAAHSALALGPGYFRQAAADLREDGRSSYRRSISELTYLGNLPVTGDTSVQIASAQRYTKYLDTFFGTPGL